MHIGQGSSCAPCCRWSPNDSRAAQTRDTSASGRRSGLSKSARDYGTTNPVDCGIAGDPWRCRSALLFVELSVKLFARRGADRLSLAQHLFGAHHGAGPVLATQEARHRGTTKGGRCHEGRARDFGLVSQAIRQDGGLGFSSCHWLCLHTCAKRHQGFDRTNAPPRPAARTTANNRFSSALSGKEASEKLPCRQDRSSENPLF